MMRVKKRPFIGLVPSMVVSLVLCLVIIGISTFLALGLVFPFSLGKVLSAATTWPFSSTKLASLLPLEIIFVGDMQFDRYVRTKAEAHDEGYASVIGPQLSKYLASADLVVGNLEGPITTQPSVSEHSVIGSTRNYIFTFSPDIVPVLQEHQIVVNLGNNHITNMGKASIEQTISYLDEAGVGWFGQLPDQSETFIYDHHGYRVALVNYNQFYGAGLAAALVDVRAAHDEADLVVVYTHWGNEYQSTAPRVIQEQARQMVSAGADLIIGSHPHVIQNSEVIDDTTVYYSLGNFIFDQYFGTNVRTGLVVKAVIDPTTGEVSFEEKKVWMENGQTKLLE